MIKVQMSKGKHAVDIGEIISDRIVKLRACTLAFCIVIIHVLSVYREVDQFLFVVTGWPSQCWWW